jgi:transglutaminase-like putative cysteine protease
MRPPLLGVALVFWGWETGLLPVGIAMAVVLEARMFMQSRWDLGRSDFNRVSDLSAILLVVMAVYEVIANEMARAVTGVIQWLPMVLFPLIACQVYSAAGRVEMAVFFWSTRKQTATAPAVDLTPAYFLLCLISASTANARSTFYAGLVGIAAWALWPARGRTGIARWIGAVALAAGLGWAGHLAVAEAQREIERRASVWMLSWIRRDLDPFRNTTALGELGEIKLSDRVVARLEASPTVKMPVLLRQASYNVFHAPSWVAVDAAFDPVLPEADGSTWPLRPGVEADGRITMSAYLPRGRGVLAIPNGTTQLDDLMVVSLARNRLGAVRVDDGLGLVKYTAHVPGRAVGDVPPKPGDLRVPPREAPAIERVAAELDLAGRPPADVVKTLRAFFLGRFSYSRYLGGARPGRTALEDFLLTSRAGHCEYFASATVLLLRQAGIPARYTVGYAAHEWSAIERRWLVRSRDAHAWAVAWIDGAWVEVDTTPPEWMPIERGPDSIWQSAADLWEWGSFLISRWRWSERQDRLAGNLGWLLLPLITILAWRLWARRRVSARVVVAPAAAPPPSAGGDSEFYRVERRLGDLGFTRQAGQPLGRWLDAMADAPPSGVSVTPLRPLLALHYRYRFDPAGLGGAERERLRAEAEAWLVAHASAPASPPSTTA